ncbi:hypothetical protein ACQZV8_04770 [Magnetococcales bacterium HHB-1]
MNTQLAMSKKEPPSINFSGLQEYCFILREQLEVQGIAIIIINPETNKLIRVAVNGLFDKEKLKDFLQKEQNKQQSFIGESMNLALSQEGKCIIYNSEDLNEHRDYEIHKSIYTNHSFRPTFAFSYSISIDIEQRNNSFKFKALLIINNPNSTENMQQRFDALTEAIRKELIASAVNNSILLPFIGEQEECQAHPANKYNNIDFYMEHIPLAIVFILSATSLIIASNIAKIVLLDISGTFCIFWIAGRIVKLREAHVPPTKTNDKRKAYIMYTAGIIFLAVELILFNTSIF